MKRSIFLCLVLFAAASPALALAADAPLDLRVPEQPNPYAAEPSPPRDPPGTYYGDTSGKPASSGLAEAEVVDDGKAKVWGSFTTGIGHSKGYGTSHFNAAEVNVSKSFGEGENSKTFNLQINVEQGDGPAFGGPAFGRPAFGGYSPYPYYGHDTHYGPPPR